MNLVKHSLDLLAEKIERNSGLSHSELTAMPNENFRKLTISNNLSKNELLEGIKDRRNWPLVRKIVFYFTKGWW